MAYTPRIMTEAGDMDAIRYAAQMVPQQLSDEQILSPVLLPAAEAKIISIVPSYASLSEDKMLLLRSATTNFVAAYAIMRTMDKERGMEYAFERQRDDLVRSLLDKAEEDIAEILGDEILPRALFSTYGPTKQKRKSGDWLPHTLVI